MKKIYLIKVILLSHIGLLFIFSSCSVTKCRYSRGFNIDIGRNAPVANVNKSSKRQKKLIDVFIEQKTDTSKLESQDQFKNKQSFFWGENRESSNIQSITLIKAKKTQNYQRLKNEMFNYKFEHRIDNQIIQKSTIQAKNPQKKRVFWDVLKFVLFILLAATILILGIYVFVLFFLIALWIEINAFLITLGLILIALITILLISLLKLIFGYHKNL